MLESKEVAINIRTKGATGEREIANKLNPIILEVLDQHGVDAPEHPVAQRNQNQSAVGGADLSNVFGISIEVKRVEQLSVNTWWNQCMLAAERNGEFPVLLYRQNRKRWRCVLLAQIPLPVGAGVTACQYTRCEISWDDFESWFRQWVTRKILNGEDVRT